MCNPHETGQGTVYMHHSCYGKLYVGQAWMDVIVVN